ncbi:MAG TPA: ABC transporter ATP-binding protein [Acetobacteraceae bacterium]|nr:ABC transporter ATP-binding protein [Acetobacteraceae bacterium]
MSFLQLESLTCRYGDFYAVRDLDLTVEQGEFVSLLGPSGCGKTTTLQMIGGFIEPSAGTVRIGGADMRRVPANRRGIGIVFQSYALFPHMRVAQNVAFGLEMRKVPRAERAERVRRALAMVHLEHAADRYPRQLSGGQQQRVALARALVIEPRVLLLDEPMSNLDAKLREEMQLELRRLQRSLRVTTIMVTHDQTEAMALSDRIALMRAGRIVQVDTPQAAYDRPADWFASSFLGKSNSFRARCVPGGLLTASGVRIAAPAGAPESGEVLCALRPERLRITPPEQGMLRATVQSRIFLGSHWLLQTEGEAGELLVYLQNATAAAPQEGDAIGLAWEPRSLVLLPPDEAPAHG